VLCGGKVEGWKGGSIVRVLGQNFEIGIAAAEDIEILRILGKKLGDLDLIHSP
jgi:hypothetical protein